MKKIKILLRMIYCFTILSEDPDEYTKDKRPRLL